SIFMVSLLIQIALLPLNLLLFGNAGFWFFLNILWLPVVDMLVLPASALGLVLAGMGMEEAARSLLHLAAQPCGWLTGGLNWLRDAAILQAPALLRPHWTALPAFALLYCTLAFAGSRGKTLRHVPRRLLLAGLALLCTGPLLRLAEGYSDTITLEVLDVGQGQALNLRGPDGLTLVLDGGGSNSPRFDPGAALVAPALSYNRPPRISAVCNSHPHQDHLGGLFHLLQYFEVRKLFDNGREARGSQAPLWQNLRKTLGASQLAAGDCLILGDPADGLRLEVLHPPRHDPAWQENDASLILRLTRHGQGLVLFTGDAERPALRHLLALGYDMRSQVVIAPHHGSNSSFLAAFYRAVQPELVLVSCGFQNRYNYPGKRLRQWLEKEGIPLYDTGSGGHMRVTWSSGGSLRLHMARPEG
ncbi:MAG: ComEC/Rec2 family competence protein, partial [Desulfovibrionaceae bacterium]|nr:ComEC/Rec2 family competence protein [Desulfovibrionaceae bacterium]